MSTGPTPYYFGDLLAIARQHWVSEMGRRLEALGYADYRRSDAALFRLLLQGPVSISRIGAVLGVTRQAARKAVDALGERGLAAVSRDQTDGRRVNVVLTEAGIAYARSIRLTIDDLNRELAASVSPEALVAADAVLRSSINDERTRARADVLVAPPVP
jgi:DNA-binding MarR family transcriptional regulator